MILRYSPIEWDFKILMFCDFLKDVSKPDNPFKELQRIESLIRVINAFARKLPPFQFINNDHNLALELFSKFDVKLDGLSLEDAKELKFRADLRYGHAIFRNNLGHKNENEKLLLKAEEDMNLVFEKTKKYFSKHGLILKALANLYMETDRFQQSSEYFLKAEKVLRKAKKDDFHKVCQLPFTLMDYAFLLLKMDRLDEAENYSSKSVRTFSWHDLETQKEVVDQILPLLLLFTLKLHTITPDQLNDEFDRGMEAYLRQLERFMIEFPELLQLMIMYSKNIYVQALVADQKGDYKKATKLYEKSVKRLKRHVEYYANNRIDMILSAERSYKSINIRHMIDNPGEYTRIKNEIAEQEKERVERDPGYFAITIQKSVIEMHKRHGYVIEHWKNLVILNQLLGNMMQIYPSLIQEFGDNLNEIIKVGDSIELDKNKKGILEQHKIMKDKLDKGEI